MLSDSLKNPFISGLLGAVITMLYIHLVGKMNKEPVRNADMIKPAILDGILVGMIVFLGISQKEENYEAPYPEPGVRM